MAVAGIVAEYDPFHMGHAWHIAQTRRALGEETAVLCVMSGSWTQRGQCALTDKWTRSALAIRGGAPPRMARAERVHLSVRAHCPRWVQLPDMTQRTAVSSPSARRVWAMCQACPMWKGSYSATIPATAMAGPPSLSFFCVFFQKRVVLLGKKLYNRKDEVIITLTHFPLVHKNFIL